MKNTRTSRRKKRKNLSQIASQKQSALLERLSKEFLDKIKQYITLQACFQLIEIIDKTNCTF